MDNNYLFQLILKNLKIMAFIMPLFFYMETISDNPN